MKRTSAERPRDLDARARASHDRKVRSSADEDAAAPILVLIIACLIFALLVLCTPATVALTPEQILSMPVLGP